MELVDMTDLKSVELKARGGSSPPSGTKIKDMNKKLYRGNGYIGGVCQGLGEWSGIPSILWRVAFLFVIPAALCIYLTLWFFIKKDFQN
tara:strand:+ start:2541 stop:2807 length:267 start_codon:yes stop_codon:yes gene_type:complete